MQKKIALAFIALIAAGLNVGAATAVQAQPMHLTQHTAMHRSGAGAVIRVQAPRQARGGVAERGIIRPQDGGDPQH